MFDDGGEVLSGEASGSSLIEDGNHVVCNVEIDFLTSMVGGLDDRVCSNDSTAMSSEEVIEEVDF